LFISLIVALIEFDESFEIASFLKALIADSGGPMFRDHVERTMATLLRLLVGGVGAQQGASSLEILSCVGRVLSSLITTVGPELQVEKAS